MSEKEKPSTGPLGGEAKRSFTRYVADNIAGTAKESSPELKGVPVLTIVSIIVTVIQLAVRCYLSREPQADIKQARYDAAVGDCKRLRRLVRFVSTMKGSRLSKEASQVIANHIAYATDAMNQAEFTDLVGECEARTNNLIATTNMDVGAALAELEDDDE